jgi:hypothetical protein
MSTIQELIAVVPTLPTFRQDFAQSLIAQATTARGLSPKQLEWVDKLVTAATAAPVAAVNVGDLSGITALFDKARQHLKFPAITMSVPAASMTVRVNVAGSGARFPGSLNVCSGEKPNMDERRAWYGRVHKDGNYEAAGNSNPAIVERLRAFAADPAGIAAEHGKLTGRCCFCNLHLSDERSTAVGYGKRCAQHYGLVWGVK